ncbi:MAG TPA: hypothetical protein VEL69_08510, partial [Ktedonobacteraceae bacterium]|nr:hypothetical protein [Ktedonobacteraceae bacterium]
MAYRQYDNIDLSDIFISREQQLAQFRTILQAWKETIVSETPQTPNDPPSLRNKIRGLVVLIYGRGGFGKTTLLDRYHQLASKQAVWVQKSRIIDWEFAAQDERHIFKCPPGEKVHAIEYFKLLRKCLAEALGKRESDFKEYIKAIRAVGEVQNRVNEVVNTIAKNEDMSWVGTLAGEGTMHLIHFISNTIPLIGRSIDSALSNEAIEDAIKKGTGAGAQIGIEQLQKARETLLNKLRPHLTDYRECVARLGLALGSDMAGFAKKQPLLIFFDTYEEIDEADEYLKLVMGAAGTRVGWVIAGRDNLWAGSSQQTRWPVPTIEYGYKDLVWPDRQLAIDFESEGVGDFTIGDILEYFHQLCQKPRQPMLPPVGESEAERILEITQGIPLAVQITAGLYFKTANMESITSTEETDARREIIAKVVRRYLLHTRGDLKESARIYGLALLRPDSSAEAKAAALDLPDIDGVSSTLSWMQRRYSFIFAKKERPTLHQEVRYFLRQWLLEEEHRMLPEVIKVNQRIYNAHLAKLKELEEKSPPFSQLSERLVEDKWVNAYLNVVEQQFWL